MSLGRSRDTAPISRLQAAQRQQQIAVSLEDIQQDVLDPRFRPGVLHGIQLAPHDPNFQPPAQLPRNAANVSITDIVRNPATKSTAEQRRLASLEANAKQRAAARVLKFTGGIDTPEYWSDLQKEYAEELDQVVSSVSTSSLKAKFRIKTVYELFAQKTLRLSEQEVEQAWYAENVRALACMFLQFYMNTSKGLQGRIKAKTLAGIMNMFTTLIVQHAWDPVNKIKCGYMLMGGADMYQKMADTVLFLVRKYKLDRYGEVKIYFGRKEVEMMVQANIVIPSPSSYRVRIHNTSKVLVPFFLTARPGSLAGTCQEYIDLGQFPVLGDLKIEVFGELDWQIVLRLKHFKGGNGIHADEQTWVLEMATQPHNITFCVVCWLIADLFLRKAFEKDYKTIEDLIADTDSTHLQISKEAKSWPLYPKLTPSGRDFLENGTVPSTAPNITATIRNLAEKAGLPSASAYALRRDAGNVFGQTLGKEIAQDMMNRRQTESIFRTHYSMNTENLNPVGIRLDEDPDHPLKENIRRRGYRSAAAYSLFRLFLQRDNGEQLTHDAAKRQIAEDKAVRNAAVQQNEEVAAKDAEVKLAWSSFMACFQVNEYAQVLHNITPMIETASGNKVGKKDVQLAEGKTIADAEQARDILLATEKDRQQIRRNAVKTFNRHKHSERTQNFKEGVDLAGTTEIRDAAHAEARKISSSALLQELTRKHALNAGEILNEEESEENLIEFENFGEGSKEVEKILRSIDLRAANKGAPTRLRENTALITAIAAPCTGEIDEVSEGNAILEAFLELCPNEDYHMEQFSIKEFRRTFLTEIVQLAVDEEKANAKVTQDEDGIPSCAECGATFSKSCHAYRHVKRQHHPWRTLLSRMTADERTFKCLCGLETEGDVEMQTHLLTECTVTDLQENLLLYQRYIQDVPEKQTDDGQPAWIFTETPNKGRTNQPSNWMENLDVIKQTAIDSHDEGLVALADTMYDIGQGDYTGNEGNDLGHEIEKRQILISQLVDEFFKLEEELQEEFLNDLDMM